MTFPIFSTPPSAEPWRKTSPGLRLIDGKPLTATVTGRQSAICTAAAAAEQGDAAQPHERKARGLGYVGRGAADFRVLPVVLGQNQQVVESNTAVPVEVPLCKRRGILAVVLSEDQQVREIHHPVAIG